MKSAIFTSLAAAAVTLCCSCINSAPPAAVSSDSYSTLKTSEHQTLPEGLKFLTLAEAQNISIQNNPDFKSAYFAIEQARANYYKAWTYYLPTVSATYSFGQTFTNAMSRDAGSSAGTFNSSNASTQISLLVFDSLQREMNILAYKHNYKQTQAAELDARRVLLRSVAYAYNDVMLASAKIKIAKADMVYNRDLLKETELKFEAGASPLSDVLNFKVRYNSAESSLYSAEYSYAVAKYSLASLLGLTQGDIPSSIEFPEMPSADGEMLLAMDTYLDMALQNRPDLKQYREAFETAKYSYYSSIAAFGPTVTFNVGLTYSGNRNEYSGRYGTTEYTAHPRTSGVSWSGQISWELFSGFRTYLSMRASEAAKVQASYNVETIWISVVTDVRSAYDNYLTNLKQVKLNQKNLEIVRKTRDLVNQEYTAGSTGITRLNEAQRDLVDAETALAEAVINMHNAKAQLQAATNSI